MQQVLRLLTCLAVLPLVSWAVPEPVATGVTYERLTRPGPVVVHVVAAQLGEASLTPQVVVAGPALTQTATLPALVDGLGRDPRVAAALNGGFTLTDATYGAPLGLLIANGELLGGPWPVKRSALLLGADGKPSIATVDLTGTVSSGSAPAVAIDGLNRPRRDGELVLYTPRFGATTKNALGGRQLVLRGVLSEAGKLVSGASLEGEVAASVDGQVNLEIPPGGAILAGSGASLAWLAARKVGDQVTLRFDSTPSLAGVRAAVGGGPRLLRGGQAVNEAAAEGLEARAQMGRQPRSAVAFNATTLFLIAVDGRQPGVSEGVDLAGLTAICQDLGATEAMELDGGGATSLYVADGLANTPSDGQPRALSNALVLLTTGEVSPTNVASLPVVDPVVPVTTTPAGTNAPKPVTEPAPTTTAPSVPEPPAPPTTEIRPVRLAVEPAEVATTVGQTVPLRVVGLDANGQPVAVDAQLLSWELSPAGANALGQVSPDGSFAAQRAGNGRLTVRLGDLFSAVDVRVTGTNAPDESTPPTTATAETGPEPKRPGQGVKRPAITLPKGERRLIDGFEQDGHWTLLTGDLVTASKQLVADPKQSGERSLKLTYDFAKTGNSRWVMVNFQDNDGKKVTVGSPKAVSVWVYGDGNGHRLRGRMTDAAGASYQVEFTQFINWDHHWARCTALVPAGVRGPLVWDGFLLSQTDPEALTAGYIFLDTFEGLY